MGRLFKEADSIQVDDYRVERQIVKTARSDGNGSYDSKNYIFTSVSTSGVGRTKAEPERARTGPEIEHSFPTTFRDPGGGVCVSFEKNQFPGAVLAKQAS